MSCGRHTGSTHEGGAKLFGRLPRSLSGYSFDNQSGLIRCRLAKDRNQPCHSNHTSVAGYRCEGDRDYHCVRHAREPWRESGMVPEQFPRDYKYMTRSTSSPPTEFRIDENDAVINAHLAQGILQAMPVLLGAFDDEGCIVAWNEECERVTGYSAAEIVGNCRALEMLYPEMEYRDFMLEEARRRRHEDCSNVWELIAKDGTRKVIEWFNLGARQIVPGWSEWRIGIDIAERQRLEIARREATRREQRRIARELHDGLGQELSGIAMIASGVAGKHADQNAGLARDLRQLAILASDSVANCRLLAHGLFPLQEHAYDLVGALRQLADATARVGGPTVTFTEATFAAPILSQGVQSSLIPSFSRGIE